MSNLLPIEHSKEAHHVWKLLVMKIIKCLITVTVVGTHSGKLLPFQFLPKDEIERCHPSNEFPEGFDIWHTPNHWANRETMQYQSRENHHNSICQVHSQRAEPKGGACGPCYF